MLLNRLVEHRRQIREQATPPGYRVTSVHWWLDLDFQGKTLQVTRTLQENGSQSYKAGVPWPVPYVKTTNNVAARLLADKASNALGVLTPKLGSRHRARAILGHAAFRDLVDTCANDTGHPAVLAVRRFGKSIRRAGCCFWQAAMRF